VNRLITQVLERVNLLDRRRNPYKSFPSSVAAMTRLWVAGHSTEWTWSFQTSTIFPDERRSVAQGALLEARRDDRASSQVSPISEENDSQRDPVCARISIQSRPSGNSTTVGSEAPLSNPSPPTLRTLGDLFQVCPSSSDVSRPTPLTFPFHT